MSYHHYTIIAPHYIKCRVGSSHVWVKYGQILISLTYKPTVGFKSPFLTQTWDETTQHFI